jgi:hypothetical protein
MSSERSEPGDKLSSPDFARVAEIIAKGPPPKWLTPALEHFSVGMAVEGDHQHFKAVVDQLDRATDTLMKWLPIWGHMSFGFKSPDYVLYIRAFLPELKKDLDRLTEKQSGRPTHIGKEVCAAVVVEAWRRIHGEVQPQSKKLFEACKAYWGACGGEPIGKEDDIYNWERTVKRLLSEDYSWVRDTVGHYETHIK